MVDSLADGMVSMSLTTYFIDRKFHPAKSVLGDMVSTSYLLSSLSSIFAGPLARRIGLVNTMVFTHVPSSLAVLLFPLPSTVAGTFALLLLRVGLNNMDQAPRTALIAAVVPAQERTAVMGITAVLRTLASTTGPSVTGVLAGREQFWVAYVAAGALRLAYDLGLWGMFINVRLNRHEQVEQGGEGRQGRGPLGKLELWRCWCRFGNGWMTVRSDDDGHAEWERLMKEHDCMSIRGNKRL